MNKFLHFDRKNLRLDFINPKRRSYFQLTLLCFAIFVMSLVPACVYIVNHNISLTIACVSFCITSLTNFLLLYASKRTSFINYALLYFSVSCIFIFLLLTGGTDGLGLYWILLLPACGIALLGRKQGFYYSLLILGVIVLILWTPIGKRLLMCEYSSEFCFKFPITYVVFLFAGCGVEIIHSFACRNLLDNQEKLKEVAEIDTLTGLKNRFWFDNFFFQKYNGKITDAEGLALLIDIDSFKYINDKYGHLAGDEILRCVSYTIKGCLKDGDNLCRWGGEEFFAFIRVCDAAEAEMICSKICETVERSNYEYNGQAIKITVSIGAIYIRKGSTINVENILCEVDRKLYESKQKGKNRFSLV